MGDHVKKRRLELGLYQAQVAKMLRVDESTVTNWEKHRTQPTLRALPKTVAYLGYDPMPAGTTRLGEMLLRYRKSRGVTQKELAKQIGIDPTTLSRLERKQGGCLPSVLEKVGAFLNDHT